MKKLSLSLLAFFMMSFQSISADGYIAAYSIKVSNPVSFVEAFDDLMTSDFGKEFPGTVTVSHFAFNGYDDASHSVTISYDSEADMAKGTQMFYTPTFGAFMDKVSDISEPIEQALNRKLISGGNDNQSDNQVYTIYRMTVKNPMKYAKAWKALVEAQDAAGNISGSYGLRALTHGNQGYYTHYAYTGSSSIEAALSEQAKLNSSDSYAKYAKATKRAIKQTSMMVVLKTYNYPNS